MSEFIFSLNATLPVFFVMVLGYVLMQKGFLTPEFTRVADKLVFQVVLPTLFFKNVYDADFKEIVDPRFMLFCVFGTLISYGLFWLLTVIFMKDRSLWGSFIQGSCRSNVAILGVAFIQNMYGNAGPAAIMVALVVPMANILSVIILSVYDNEAKGQSRKELMRTTCLNICKNPLILALLLALVVSGVGLRLPTMVYKTVSNVAALATPLSLLVLGASFGGKEALAKLRPTMVATVIRLVLIPALLMPVAIVMGFRGQELATLLIMAGAPTAVSSYIMAKNMNNDGALASSIVASTTLFASVSLTLFIFAFKVLGYL